MHTNSDSSWVGLEIRHLAALEGRFPEQRAYRVTMSEVSVQMSAAPADDGGANAPT